MGPDERALRNPQVRNSKSNSKSNGEMMAGEKWWNGMNKWQQTWDATGNKEKRREEKKEEEKRSWVWRD